MINSILKSLTGLDITIEDGICKNITGKTEARLKLKLSDYCNELASNVFNIRGKCNIVFILTDDLVIPDKLGYITNVTIDIRGITNTETKQRIYRGIIHKKEVQLLGIRDTIESKINTLYAIRSEYNIIMDYYTSDLFDNLAHKLADITDNDTYILHVKNRDIVKDKYDLDKVLRNRMYPLLLYRTELFMNGLYNTNAELYNKLISKLYDEYKSGKRQFRVTKKYIEAL